MKTQIQFVGGEHVEFDDDATIKLAEHGVEVVERDGDETVRVLFPWSRIEKVTQRGIEITAIYTY